MKRSIVLATNVLRPLLPLARQAEAAGFHRLWTTEYNNRDALIRAALVAVATTRIQVATGIAYSFTRAPLAAASAAADVQIASQGRFALGLGMGTRGMRSRWYGLDVAHPASAYAEYVSLVRAAWAATGGLAYRGTYFQADVPGFGFPERDLMDRLEVWGSGVNATMLRTAAACCDGVALHALTLAEPYWAAAIEPALDEGSRRAGRRVKLAAWVVTSIGDDAEAARWQAKRNLAFYFSTPSYHSAAAGMPWAGAAGSVMTAFRGGASLDEVAKLVAEDMVDDLTLSGTPAQVRERLPALEAELASRGVDELVFQLAASGASEDEVVASCDAIIRTCGPGDGA